MTLTLANWLAGRPPAELAELLAARPEAALPPAPRDLLELSQRLAIPGAVAGTLHRLPTPALEVVEVLQLLGPGHGSRTGLADWLGRPTDDPGLVGTLDLLARHALVWPEGETLHMVAPLYATFPYPLGLAAPAATLLSRCPADELRRIARTLGLRSAGRKQELVAAVAAWLRDPDRVRKLVAGAPSATRARLRELAHSGPELGFPHWYGSHQLDDELRWAHARGLVLVDGWGMPSVPREAAVALRGPDWHAPFSPYPPELTTVDLSGAAAGREAAAAATGAVEALTAVLATVEETPPALLKAGGVGVRELRRLARAVGGDRDTVRLWLELADRSGLVAPARDPDGARLLPTARYDDWLALEPAEQLAQVVSGWTGLGTVPLSEASRAGRDGANRPPPALGHDQPGQLPQLVRVQLLTVLTEQPAGRGLADPGQLPDRLRWRHPLACTGVPGDLPSLEQLTAGAWREAELLGLVAHGGLTPVGRALAGGSPDDLLTACRSTVPAAVSEAVFQADLTAVVPGSPARPLAELLDAVADRESRGGAVTWRFSAGSVRRALDEGHRAEELLDRLRGYAVGGDLPQPLSYLVTDVARRHGTVRVRPVACVIRADDPALVAELAGSRALRALRLRPVAETVLGSAAPPAETLAALRQAGYAPVSESDDGVPVLSRPPRRRAEPVRGRGTAPDDPAPDRSAPDPLALATELLAAPAPEPVPRQREHPGGTTARGTQHRPVADPADRTNPPVDRDGGNGGDDLLTEIAKRADRLSPGEWRLLAHAVGAERPVTIGYVNAQGRRTIRVIESAELAGGHLVAWCRLRDDERMFALHRIESVAPAP